MASIQLPGKLLFENGEKNVRASPNVYVFAILTAVNEGVAVVQILYRLLLR